MDNRPSVPAHAYYGTPVGGYRVAAIEGARIAAPSAPYVGRGDKCAGNDDTCNANRVRGQEFCAGHMRQQKAKQPVEPVEGGE
jgi:hypothetical protein